MTSSLLIVRLRSSDIEVASDWLFALGANAIEQRDNTGFGRPAEEALVELAAGFESERESLRAHDLISQKWPARIESTGDESRWRDRWLDFIEPCVVGPLLIQAPWHTSEITDTLRAKESGVEHDLIIDPGTSFGSGHHGTTQLCIQTLTSQLRPGDHILDVGSGSGILSIAAALLGAGRTIGFDIAHGAISTASANAETNGVDSICQFYITDGTIAGAHPKTAGQEPLFDIVMANIVIGDLLPLIGQLCDQSRRTIILSGFLVSQRERIERELTKRIPLATLTWSASGEWGCVSATK